MFVPLDCVCIHSLPLRPSRQWITSWNRYGRFWRGDAERHIGILRISDDERFAPRRIRADVGDLLVERFLH